MRVPSKKWPLSTLWTLLIFILPLSAKASPTLFCNHLFDTPSKIDSSSPAGILMHGEHWIDLILAQGGSSVPRHLDAFAEIAAQLVQAAKRGQWSHVNEKIDGSPSIVVGFQPNAEAFVAYKGHFSRKTEQILITSTTPLDVVFKRSESLQQIFEILRKEIGTAMNDKMTEFSEFIFQGDLLFVEGDNRRIIKPDEIVIQANAIPYSIRYGSPYFEEIRAAKVGIVFHSVGRRRIQADGSLKVEAISDDQILRKFVNELKAQNIFVIDPFKEKVDVAKVRSLELATEIQVDKLIQEIRHNFTEIPPAFTEAWQQKYEAKWRIFLNSFLRPPADGGPYRAVSEGRHVNVDDLISSFEKWAESRVEVNLASDFKVFAAQQGPALKKVLQSYISAIQIQCLLLPSLQEAFQSKLGGGPSEGLMLKTPSTIVKLVDRLTFTVLNNQRWSRHTEIVPMTALPAPFNSWDPNATYIILKGQPIHAGHIGLIRQAVLQNQGRKVYVLLSDKEPNLEASNWKDTEVSATKKELREKNYTYLYSADFRQRILNYGLHGLPVEILVAPPPHFWSYLRAAKEANLKGQVRLIVGEKEIDENRYDSQMKELEGVLEIQAIPLKMKAISATQIRAAIRNSVYGSAAEKTASMELLNFAYAFVSPAQLRGEIIQQLIEDWKNVDKIATRLTMPVPRIKALPRAKKAPRSRKAGGSAKVGVSEGSLLSIKEIA